MRMKRLLRGMLSDLSYRAIRLMEGRTASLRILMYHRVTDAHPADRLCVPVARFAEQMHYLHEAGYQSVSFLQAVQWVGGAAELPSKAVVLTFDDGFEDNFRYAYPAMARYGFTGCFFVPSAFITSGSNGHAPEDQPMSWTQLQELLREGHEVGAHSITHVKLTQIPIDHARHEVRGSKHALEQKLQRPVDFFCYPSGDYNEAVKEAVQASGYFGACTVKPGANRPGTDRFALRRTEISAVDSLWDFQKKLAGAYDWMHLAVQQTQKATRALVGDKSQATSDR